MGRASPRVRRSLGDGIARLESPGTGDAGRHEQVRPVAPRAEAFPPRGRGGSLLRRAARACSRSLRADASSPGKASRASPPRAPRLLSQKRATSGAARRRAARRRDFSNALLCASTGHACADGGIVRRSANGRCRGPCATRDALACGRAEWVKKESAKKNVRKATNVVSGSRLERGRRRFPGRASFPTGSAGSRRRTRGKASKTPRCRVSDGGLAPRRAPARAVGLDVACPVPSRERETARRARARGEDARRRAPRGASLEQRAAGRSTHQPHQRRDAHPWPGTGGSVVLVSGSPW